MHRDSLGTPEKSAERSLEPSVLSDPLVIRAREFGLKIHNSQTRRDGSPFFTHCERVARRVAEWTDYPVIVAAALLHDAREQGYVCDSEKSEPMPVTFSDLAGEFGKKVAYYVSILSKEPRGPKSHQLVAYCAKLRRAPAAVKLIKSADILDNASDNPVFGWLSKSQKMMKAVKSGRLGKFRKSICLFASQFNQILRNMEDFVDIKFFPSSQLSFSHRSYQFMLQSFSGHR